MDKPVKGIATFFCGWDAAEIRLADDRVEVGQPGSDCRRRSSWQPVIGQRAVIGAIHQIHMPCRRRHRSARRQFVQGELDLVQAVAHAARERMSLSRKASTCGGGAHGRRGAVHLVPDKRVQDAHPDEVVILAVLLRQVDRIADASTRCHVARSTLRPSRHELDRASSRLMVPESSPTTAWRAADDFGQHLEALAAVERMGHVGAGVQISSLTHSHDSRGSTFAEGARILAAWRTLGEDRRRCRSSWMRKLITAVSLASS